jgi:hypothetical protein
MLNFRMAANAPRVLADRGRRRALVWLHAFWGLFGCGRSKRPDRYSIHQKGKRPKIDLQALSRLSQRLDLMLSWRSNWLGAAKWFPGNLSPYSVWTLSGRSSDEEHRGHEYERCTDHDDIQRMCKAHGRPSLR